MATTDKSVRVSRQRRCVNACNTCKRRKERCDGAQPCGKCISRRVPQDCTFVNEPAARKPRGSHTVARRSAASVSAGPATSENDANLFSPDSVNCESTQAHTLPGRLGRHVGPITDSPHHSNIIHDPNQDHIVSTNIEDLGSPRAMRGHDADVVSTEVPQLSRLLQDSKGGYMFIGDSSNLSFLHIMRRLVERSIGSCAFVDDPVRHVMVEASPSSQSNNAHSITEIYKPLKPDLEESRRYVENFLMVTHGVLDLFDKTELMQALPQWLENSDAYTGFPSSIFFLVFAIGAQICLGDAEKTADTFFKYGRYLTSSTCMEEPSILTVQLNALITMYLLGSARRNAAFMYLGTAVRAAYALGLHREDVARMFPKPEYMIRERIWKVIRVLDLFLSTTLGRPPSTFETRDTTKMRNHHPSIELCAIFEKILTDVYSKRMVTSDAFKQISERQKSWTSQLLDHQAIAESGAYDLNIGLLHLQGDFHLSVILLTRPYLIQAASIKASTPLNMEQRSGSDTPTAIMSNKLLVHACVDSSIRSITIHSCLLDRPECPKRLPFIVNSAFASALVIGFAYFCDLDSTFPLSSNLNLAVLILRQFTADALAKRFLDIIEHLQDACNEYIRQRTRAHSSRRGRLVEGIFGSLNDIKAMTAATSSKDPQNDSRDARTVSSYSRPPQNSDRNTNAAPQPCISHSASAPLTFVPNSNINFPYAVNTPIDFDELNLLDLSPQSLHFDSYDDNQFLFPMTGLQ